MKDTDMKNRKFTERETEIYRLGFRNGENQLQQTINCILKTNSNLMEELLRLDLHKPVMGDPRHITITLRALVFRNMARALRTKKTTQEQLTHYSKVIRKHIAKYDEQQRIIAAKIEKNLLDRE